MKLKVGCLTLGLILHHHAFAEESEPVKPTFNGAISVVSAYVSRGGTNSPENSDAVIQGSLSAGYNGFYAYYWFSKLGYSIKELQGGHAKSADYYEHDLFLGYASRYKQIDYNLFTAIYFYPGAKHSTGVETGIDLSTKLSERNDRVKLSLMTYVNDVYYNNKWDTYMTVGYDYPFNDKWNIDFTAGFSYFQDKGKYEGDLFLNTKKDFAFRHLTTKINRKLFENTNAWIQYIVGGENRAGIDQKNMVVAGIKYSF
ncbi:hypothetical protein B9T31_13735 [Acinetobacter sp. ANC 4558]|uniref:hypothetical protein n=1 Tax=Acinetobacter sp. ANC 4558 TaxID=1977876 RepID=UPI000A333AAC|nr:hypothetical protein [Acinetobacter sp. ANC 4558]OTG84208.1 hypothetical protein B9T31_13735 [Acinetobacter sp. ANC 4558]